MTRTTDRAGLPQHPEIPTLLRWGKYATITEDSDGISRGRYEKSDMPPHAMSSANGHPQFVAANLESVLAAEFANQHSMPRTGRRCLHSPSAILAMPQPRGHGGIHHF